MNCELMLTYDTPALRQTGSRNLTGPKTLSTVTEKNAMKNILDGRKDRGKTVYPPPPSGSGGYDKIQKVKLTFCVSYMIHCFSFHLMTLCVGICELR